MNKLISLALTFYQNDELEKGSRILYKLLNTYLNQFDKYDALSLLGLIEARLGQYEKAIKLLNIAYQINSKDDRLLCNLASVYYSIKLYEKSNYFYSLALTLNPSNLIAKLNRAIVLMENGFLDEAVIQLNDIVKVDPQNIKSYFLLGELYRKKKEYKNSIINYEKIITIDPNNIDAIFNKGIILSELGDFKKSIFEFNKAIIKNPNESELFLARGNQYSKLRNFKDAIEDYDCAIRINKNNYEAYLNLGAIYHDIGEFEEALKCYDEVININPSYAEAYWNKSHTLLITGKYEEGFKLYEWRLKVDKFRENKIDIPIWNGEKEIKGKRILISGEQGLGDIVQFSRYVKLVKDFGAIIIFRVDKTLINLFSKLDGVDILISYEDNIPDSIDYHCPLLSLPCIFNTNINNVPSSKSYIKINQTKVNQWLTKLGDKKKFRIGIVWSSFSNIENEIKRGINLSKIIEILPINNYEFISLQKKIKQEDLELCNSNMNKIKFFGNELYDFSDTASLAYCMDLVISTCTSVPHVTGALGIPTWILLSHVPDWRWQMGTTDTPWYGCVTLYRQESDSDWGKVLKHVAKDLVKKFPVFN